MDIKLFTQTWGTGEPLVLLHGNGGNYRYFKYQIEPFAQHYQVIAIDTRGHGQSPRGIAPFTLTQFAEDLKVYLDEEGIASCHLLGFSDGGNIAMLFALRYPQYVKRLILNGANFTPWGVKLTVQLPVIGRWAVHRFIGLWSKKSYAKWEILNLMVTQPNLTAKQLTQIPCQTLVVAGEQDMIRTSHTKKLARSLPHHELSILPGDHFVARRNWQAFNQVVLDFLVKKEEPKWDD